jgi:hypothetical protein
MRNTHGEGWTQAAPRQETVDVMGKTQHGTRIVNVPDQVRIPAHRYQWESIPATPESEQRKNVTLPSSPSIDNAGPQTQHRPTPTSSLPTHPSWADIKELSDSVWKSFDAGPSRIPIPISTSSRRSSTSSHGPISRQSSIASSASMSRRTSTSSISSSPLDGRIGPRSPNAGYRFFFNSMNVVCPKTKRR